jgi:predicted amidohydrolase YtcJ
MRSFKLSLCSLFLVWAWCACPGRAFGAGLEADLVIYNGKIMTLNSPDPKSFQTAQAAAIYDGKFVAVGSTDEVMAFAGAKTQKIDLEGRTVLPGLVETHAHIYNYAAHWFPKDQAQVEESDPPITYTNKADFLAQLRTLALKKKPGEWIVMGPRGGMGGVVVDLQQGVVTLADMDKAAPNNPVHLHWNVTVEGLVNSKALNPLLERYPKIKGVKRDAKGNPTGRVTGVANLTLWYEFWPQVPAEQIGPYYKMEMDEIAREGLTTVSTRLQPNHLSGYSWIHSHGELPVRMAYTLEAAARSEITPAVESRIIGLQGGGGNNFWGAGDDKLWMIGITVDSIDSVAGLAGSCVRKAFPREAINFPLWKYQFYGPNGTCRLMESANYNDIDVLRYAAKYGFRVAAVHVSGDRAVDQYLDAMEELSKDYPQIIEQRWGIDHCQVVHEDQAQRARKYKPMFSCGPTFLWGGDKGAVGAFALVYNEKEAGDAVIPFRRFLNNGLVPVMELDSHGFHPFLALQIIINRKDQNGKVWGPDQALTRIEALYTYTRWASQYLLKENFLGSIEPGKAGDFIVLDKDYLTVPEDEIGRIDPLLTVMAGKVTYSEPKFAASHSLPTVGFQGNPTWWRRGTPGERPQGEGGGG